MKQFPRPMLEELHARRDALCAAEFPEGPRPPKHLPTLDEVVARINEDANDPSINGRCQEADKGKPLPDPAAPTEKIPTLREIVENASDAELTDPGFLRKREARDRADFFKQMSAMEARSLSDLRAEAGGPVLHPEVAALRKEMGAYRYRAPGTNISAAEAGTVRAVPQEQWEAMRAIHAAQVELESLTLVFRAYEAHHLAKKTGDSDYKAGVNRAHATRTSALALRIQEALK